MGTVSLSGRGTPGGKLSTRVGGGCGGRGGDRGGVRLPTRLCVFSTTPSLSGSPIPFPNSYLLGCLLDCLLEIDKQKTGLGSRDEIYEGKGIRTKPPVSRTRRKRSSTRPRPRNGRSCSFKGRGRRIHFEGWAHTWQPGWRGHCALDHGELAGMTCRPRGATVGRYAGRSEARGWWTGFGFPGLPRPPVPYPGRFPTSSSTQRPTPGSASPKSSLAP